MENFYHSTEIDLRKEFDKILNGFGPESSKAILGLIRRIDLDSKGEPVKCPCVDRITNEQDRDYFCPICFGERYTWKEAYVKYYKVSISTDQHGDTTVWDKIKPFGLINLSLGVFYFRYDTLINVSDKIIDIALNLEGNIIKPVQRQTIWAINQIAPFRSSHGRLEYIKIFCNSEDPKYLSPPTL